MAVLFWVLTINPVMFFTWVKGSGEETSLIKMYTKSVDPFKELHLLNGPMVNCFGFFTDNL